jgi:transcriptional regulator with PAS, ATPase and Fis domain
MAKVDVQHIKQRFSIIGNSPLLDREIEKALLIAPTDASVLIYGESGVGKEVFPQIIHQNSLRKHGSYIAVNCGAIPEGTIDSELFGHEKGSFTGALGERKGYFEVVNGGTIFLDEVGELPMATQARLLRVLETGEFMKVGSSNMQKTNVRVVAATNVDLIQAIRNGKFRDDLYYRLNTIPILVPPLRERKEDIPLLFRKFAADFADKYKMPAIHLTDDARLMMMNYRWPGNIRELKNVTERLSVLEQEREISTTILKPYLTHPDMDRLPVLVKNGGEQAAMNATEREMLYQVFFEIKKEVNELKNLVHGLMSGSIPVTGVPSVASSPVYQTPNSVMSAPITKDHEEEEPVQYADEYEEEALSLEEVERDMIKKALERNNGKRRNAAQDLKISERTLYRKIKEYGLE